MTKFGKHIEGVNLLDITEEMHDFFLERTAKHIRRVQKVAKKLGEGFPHINDELLLQLENHDDSKYTEPEQLPYIHITWRRKLEKIGISYEVSDELKELIHIATFHHVLHNKHHPEHHDTKYLDNEGRDKSIVDGTKMDGISVAEMVCDWVAMTQEVSGHSDASQWVQDNVGVRWTFTDEQKMNIDAYVRYLGKTNEEI